MLFIPILLILTISNPIAMPETLLTELLKAGTLVAVFGWIAYTLWKRYDKANTELKEEVKQLRTRYENELLADRVELKLLVRENVEEKKELSEALTGFKSFLDSMQKANAGMVNRAANVMQCLTDEIKIVKPILEKIQKGVGSER